MLVDALRLTQRARGPGVRRRAFPAEELARGAPSTRHRRETGWCAVSASISGSVLVIADQSPERRNPRPA